MNELCKRLGWEYRPVQDKLMYICCYYFKRGTLWSKDMRTTQTYARNQSK